MKIDKIVVKVASRCNINCSYCYMYNLGDMSYKLQPKFIENETVRIFAQKMLYHLQTNSLTSVVIIIHGGEPLLMKKDDMVSFIKHFDIMKKNDIKVVFYLQTNGILIDDEWCRIFKKYDINVGISLDGPKHVNDAFRVDKQGKGTYDKVIKGINVLKNNKFNTSVLSVMNLGIDTNEYYTHFKNLNVKSLDVLLLDANYDNRDSVFAYEMSPSEWYIKLFDQWYNDSHKFHIRFFNLIIKEIIGESQGLDSLGVSENNVLVLETNGGLEAVDVLKLCGDSFTKNGININSDEIDEVKNSDLIEIYYNSGKYLPKKCLACPVQEICGGGYLPHRYSSENGFNNPSIYCNDLLKLITHIQNTVVDNLPLELVKESGLTKLTYEDALKCIDNNLLSIESPGYIEKLESFKKKL